MVELAEIPMTERTTTPDTGNEKVRITEVVIPEKVREDLRKGVNRYLGVVQELHPHIAVPLARSGELAYTAAEGLAERQGLSLPTDTPAVIGQELSIRAGSEDELDIDIKPEFMDQEEKHRYFAWLRDDAAATAVVGKLAGDFDRVLTATGKPENLRVELVDDWRYFGGTAGLTAPWIIAEALRKIGAVDLTDLDSLLAANPSLAKAEPYNMLDLHLSGLTIGRSMLLENGAWSNTLKLTNLPGVNLLPLHAQDLAKDLLKGGYEGENNRIVPFSTWDDVRTYGETLIGKNGKLSTNNPADILAEKYHTGDLLQFHTRTRAALRATL